MMLGFMAQQNWRSMAKRIGDVRLSTSPKIGSKINVGVDDFK